MNCSFSVDGTGKIKKGHIERFPGCFLLYRLIKCSPGFKFRHYKCLPLQHYIWWPLAMHRKTTIKMDRWKWLVSMTEILQDNSLAHSTLWATLPFPNPKPSGKEIWYNGHNSLFTSQLLTFCLRVLPQKLDLTSFMSSSCLLRFRTWKDKLEMLNCRMIGWVWMLSRKFCAFTIWNRAVCICHSYILQIQGEFFAWK